MSDDEWAYTEEYVESHSLCCDQCKRLRGVLAGLLHDFQRMPDAGLTADDPRYRWWYETAETRKHAREALGVPTNEEQR